MKGRLHPRIANQLNVTFGIFFFLPSWIFLVQRKSWNEGTLRPYYQELTFQQGGPTSEEHFISETGTIKGLAQAVKWLAMVERPGFGVFFNDAISSTNYMTIPHTDRLYHGWDPPSILTDRYRGVLSLWKTDRSVKLTTHLHVIPTYLIPVIDSQIPKQIFILYFPARWQLDITSRLPTSQYHFSTVVNNIGNPCY